jgi:hypothetical protein
MPFHDWTRVDAGVFHYFHFCWIRAIVRHLNTGVLPDDYYAMGEQHAIGFEPDVLTLHATQPVFGNGSVAGDVPRSSGNRSGGVLLAPPKARPIAETDMEFYRRKQNTVTVRHVSGDRVVALIEIVSPGNKSTLSALEKFVRKAAEFLEQRVHMLIVDLLPPGRQDSHGIHAAVWDYIAGQEYTPAPGKPLTLAAYESDLAIRAYVEPVAMGDVLPDMPLFIEPGGCVQTALEATYQTAWEDVPQRWKTVIEGPR